MNKDFSVSVIIPTYNASATIMQTLHSVFDQSFQVHEIIVVDDGSTDNTREILQPLVESGKIVYFHQKNQGCGVARNLGIKHATGTHIALLDSDDYWHPEKLERQMAEFKNDPNLIVCSTEAFLVDSITGAVSEGRRTASSRLRSGFTLPYFTVHNIITLSSAVVNANTLRSVGGFTERYDLMMVADLDLWLKLAPLGRFHAIGTPLTYYRTRPTITQAQIRENHRQVRDVFTQRLGAPFFAKPWIIVGFIRSSFLYHMQSFRIVNTYKNIGLKGIAKELWRRFWLRAEFIAYPYALVKLASFRKRTDSSIDDILAMAYKGTAGVLVLGQIESEIKGFLERVKVVKPKRILEIGTANGGNLFVLSQMLEKDGSIISLDLPGGHWGGGYSPMKQRVYKSFLDDKDDVMLIRGDSHAASSRDEVERLLDGHLLDILFIDGDHTYEGVKADFDMYSPFVRKGGIIGFHDIADPADGDFGVQPFWNEVKKNYRHEELVNNPTQKGYGIGVLYVE